MATLPSEAALGERPVPQPTGAVARYEPPNWRQVGMAGQAISGAGRDLEETANILAAAKERQDQLVAQSAANSNNQAAVSQQYDPKTGWANAKEGQAVGQPFIDTNLERFKTSASGIREGLQNENQKNIFDQHVQFQQSKFQAALLAHQAHETDKFNSSTENATLNNTLASMARDPNNELNFQTGLEQINGTIEQSVQRQGLPDAVKDELKRKYLVAAYGSRIDSLARGSPDGAPPDPKAAQRMLAQVWDNLGPAGPHIWDKLQGAVATVDAKNQGTAAFHEAVGTLASPAMPRDLGLPVGDKPFTQQRIDQITKFVQAPSPWEKDILAAAQATGVNPAEIKLKIAIESGGNPQAVNPVGGHGDHATGLGQFMTATAKQYGIEDRNDPVQSIWGIARFLKAHGGVNGSNMTAADQAYIGSGDASKQYVENTRAARQQAIGGGGGQTQVSSAQLEGLEGQVIANAEAKAQVDGPNDPGLRDKYVMEARRQYSVALQTVRGQEYQQFTGVLDSAMKNGAQSQSDLPGSLQTQYDQLPPQRREAIDAQFRHNAAAARGEFVKSDPQVVNSLQRRIYLPDGDPQKITQPGQLFDYMGKGLNYTDQQHLVKEMKDAQTPEGSPFMKQTNEAKTTARKMLTATVPMMDPANVPFAEEGAYRFALDLDNKIKAYRAAGKDPQSLLTPGSPDYALNPMKVGAFMPNEQEIAAARANKVAPPVAAPSAAVAFASESEATAAAAAGKIKPGDRIKIGAQTGTWH